MIDFRFLRFILVLFILSVPISFSIQAEEISSEWRVSFTSLSNEEKKALEIYFRTMLVNSQGGFVLFGSKPMCEEGILLSEKCKVEWIGTQRHMRSVNLWEGQQVWEKHFARLKSNKLLICCKNQPNTSFTDWKHLIWINPDRLKKTIDQSLALFQYVLGPNLTSQEILEYLSNPTKDIPEDYALQGIILGFGEQNSLYYRRLELIDIELYSKEKLPFKPKYERLHISDPCGIYMGFDLCETPETLPSLKYATLSDEYQDLHNMRSSSSKANNQDIATVPMFAIFKRDQKTLQILSQYENDSLKIQHLLSQKDFLETTLRVIFE